MIPFVISVYTYNTARVFTPLFLFVFYLLNFRYLLKNLKYAVLVFNICDISNSNYPLCIVRRCVTRYKLVSITDDKGLIQN